MTLHRFLLIVQPTGRHAAICCRHTTNDDHRYESCTITPMVYHIPSHCHCHIADNCFIRLDPRLDQRNWLLVAESFTNTKRYSFFPLSLTLCLFSYSSHYLSGVRTMPTTDSNHACPPIGPKNGMDHRLLRTSKCYFVSRTYSLQEPFLVGE